MLELYLQADKYIVLFKSNRDEVLKYINEFSYDFERLSITFKILEKVSNYDIELLYVDGKNMNLSFDNQKTFSLECPWEKINKSTILPMAFRLIVEWLRQRDNEIKVHASAIERNGQIFMFMAPSEGGKTTTALAMCQEHNCNLCANDAAVLKLINGVPFFLRGDTKFKFRENSLKEYCKDSKEKIITTEKNENPWYERIVMEADDLGVSVMQNILPVTKLFFVKLDPLIEKCNVTKYSTNYDERKKYWFKPKMMFYQNISGTIRGVDLIPIGNNGEILGLNIPVIDTAQMSSFRSKFINELFDKCDVYQVRGPLNDVLYTINNLM